MRTVRDRLRHMVLFEVIALLVVAPLGGAVFDVPITHFGVVAIVSSFIAMAWNYAFNLGFDHALLRTGRSLRKTLPVRVFHAVLFEVTLTCLLVPFIMWFLDLSILQALIMDVALAGVYMVYAFVFNWVYDVVFPLRSDDTIA